MSWLPECVFFFFRVVELSFFFPGRVAVEFFFPAFAQAPPPKSLMVLPLHFQIMISVNAISACQFGEEPF